MASIGAGVGSRYTGNRWHLGARVQYNFLPKIGARWRDEIAELSEDTAAAIRDRAIELAPVDTGELIESIGIRPVPGRRLQWEVVVEAEHGHYVEYGTYRMAAQPYLIPAWEEYHQPFIDDVTAILNLHGPRRIAA